MSTLEVWVRSNQEHLLVSLLAAVTVLAVIAVIQAIALRRVQSRWRHLLDGAAGVNVERMLLDHLRERVHLEQASEDHAQRLTHLEKRLQIAKSYVGVVRYDAFPDVGGQQSFSLAIYDEEGDGAVITSLVGRADCRVYGKSIQRGEGQRALSEEERRAIQEAAKPARSRSTSP